MVAQKHCPDALHQAMAIEMKFKKVLFLFHECHQIYDKSAVTDETINELGNQNKSKLNYHDIDHC